MSSVFYHSDSKQFVYLVAMTEQDFLVVKYWLVSLCPCFHECFIPQWVTVAAYETGLGEAISPVNYRTAVACKIAVFLTLCLHRLLMKVESKLL